MRLSPARLEALLRRRALERLVRVARNRTHAQLAQSLREAGFAASRLSVTKDLQLLGYARAAEVRYHLALRTGAQNPKE